ncbi:MAG: hypothetical protein PWQ06_573 [Anaerophaga sp.]|nr:hypothetical protein [Anaerophaga sp.]
MKKSFFALLLAFCFSACMETVTIDEERDKYPDIFPDYTEVTIPPNVAPLNFRIDEPNITKTDVTIVGQGGKTYHCQSKKEVVIPAAEWNDIIGSSVGDTIVAKVCIKQQERWVKYKSFPIYISSDSIDYGLSYRLIAPGYEVYSKMGIYQRELSSFDQKPIIENTLIPGSCVNCHSYRETNTDDFSIHIRGAKGGTLLKHHNLLEMLDTKTKETLSSCVYPYWHPSGNYIAYSVNKTQQAFHSADIKRIEVFDHASDVVIYDVRNHKLITMDLLKSENNFETFPAFSPDGKKLYFCSSEARQVPGEFKDIKYNLLSVLFDAATGCIGNQVDTLVNARGLGKTVSFPRPSYDGKFLMFTMFDYGNFSIWHPEADLWMLKLETGEKFPLENLNSDHTESYHSWSSNSRWVVFSSRRVNGLYTMPYIGHIDEEGNSTKPFLLPQRSPDFYDQTFYSFNVPEFINQAVEIDARSIENKVKAKHKQVTFAKEK